jgi:O-antigen/teichoic acid export membrane protein
MSLLKHSSILIVGVIISNGLAYVFHFIAGRMLGPEEYGVFGALIALLTLTALPGSAINNTVTKYTSLFYINNDFRKIASLRKKVQNDVLVYSTILLLLFILFSNHIANFLKINTIIPVILLGITIVESLLLPINNGVLQGMKKFRLLSLNTIIEAALRLVFLVIFMFLGYKATGAFISYTLSYFVIFIIIFANIRDFRNELPLEESIKIKPIYKFGFQVLIVDIVLQSIINIPSLLIKHFFTNEFTGYWVAALNIARISLAITGAITTVMFPEIVGEIENTKKKKIFYKAILLVLLTSSFISIILFIIPEHLIQILYGYDYIKAAPLMGWMSIAMILLGLLQLLFSYRLAKLP